MATDAIQIQVKLYAKNGGASLPSETDSVTLDMAGTHMGSSTQVLSTSDEALALPADCTGRRHLTVKNLEAENGIVVSLSNATGGSFAAGLFAELVGADVNKYTIPSGASVYAKSASGTPTIEWKVCQV